MKPYTLLLGLLFVGCSPSHMAVEASLSLIENQVVAMQEERDPELAKQAIPSNLKMLEGLLKHDPENARILVNLAEGFCGYAFSFLEDTEPERASSLYARGRDYAARATTIMTGREKWKDLSLNEWSRALNEVKTSHQSALFWMGQCWGNWLKQNLDSVEAFSDIPRLEKLMNKVHDLNPSFHYAGPHLFLGAFYGGRSKLLGGKPEKSLYHFKKALELTENKYLLARLIFAKTYAVQNQNRELFEVQLQAILQAPNDLFPEQELANQVARKKATKLLERIDELF
ncbi:TRAP transporter TatT component family protein [Nitrospinae bacterium]|nr:TRAP transporter TatT component family protein [Nitrospinota bacterium]